MSIEFPYKIQQRVLVKEKYSRFYYPILPAVIRIPSLNISSAPFAEKFLIDSGASISIIHQRNKKIFEDHKPIDTTRIIFGNSEQILDVYEVTLRINGNDYDIIAALAKKLKINFSLLGYFRGIEMFDIFVMNNKKRNFKLINKI